MVVALVIIVFGVVSFAAAIAYSRYNLLMEVERLTWVSDNLDGLNKLINEAYEGEIQQSWKLKDELKRVKSQKKSSEVRTGLIAEQLAPFLDNFPYPKADGTDIVFLGRPLDFLVYTEKGIHFVEVKSGKASLSTKQRRIKKLIEEGKVTFEVYRIKGE